MKKIQTQTELSPRALVLACAEGLLGELIKNARMGFSDMATELPLHPTVQQIAASRGYHHHHEYPVIATQGRGDHKRLDFVFSKTAPSKGAGKSSRSFVSLVPCEMKVIGRRSKNTPPEGTKNQGVLTEMRSPKDVTDDLMKLKAFCDEMRKETQNLEIRGYLIIVNLSYDSGICWDIPESGGVKPHAVHLVERFEYSHGQISKSVTVYEVGRG